MAGVLALEQIGLREKDAADALLTHLELQNEYKIADVLNWKQRGSQLAKCFAGEIVDDFNKLPQLTDRDSGKVLSDVERVLFISQERISRIWPTPIRPPTKKS